MKLHELFEEKERSILSVMGEQEDLYPVTFVCSGNQLTSLVGAPSIIDGDLWCANNNLTSLKGINKIIKEINGYADFRMNPIKSHVLGLLRIKGLRQVWMNEGKDLKEVKRILDKHLQGDRDIFACQSELLDAGLEDYAQL